MQVLGCSAGLRAYSEHNHASVTYGHASGALGLVQVLCGIAEGGGHVHLVTVYQSAHGDARFSDKLSVSYRLPVREDD